MLTFNNRIKFIDHLNGAESDIPVTEFQGHMVVATDEIGTIAIAGYNRIDLSSPCIMVSSQFFMMPDNIQEFILFHEVGHIINGDIKAPSEDDLDMNQQEVASVLADSFEKRRKLPTVEPIEIGADLYAVNVLGRDRVMKALSDMEAVFSHTIRGVKSNPLVDEETSDHICNMAFDVCRELNMRIEIIKDYPDIVGDALESA